MKGTLNPTPWGKYTRKTKVSEENDYYRSSHLQNEPPSPKTIDTDFVSNLRVKIRVQCENASAPEVLVE